LVGFEREEFEHHWCSCFASFHSVEFSIMIYSSERP
jgi:hypothetical protein